MSSKPVFTRGYKECRERLAKNSHFSKSCFNCAYYFQARGDKEEVCQNNNVLEYDMVVTENNIYCVRWTPPVLLEKENNPFRKVGRARLDDL